LIAAYTCDRVIVSCSIDALANPLHFLVNDAFILAMKFTTQRLPEWQMLRRFIFGQRTADRIKSCGTLTTEGNGRFHYAAATVTIAVSDTLTYRVSGNHCRKLTFCGSQR
jgi:hypothetical protein